MQHRNGVTALPNSPTLSQLGATLGTRPIEVTESPCLPSRLSRVRIPSPAPRRLVKRGFILGISFSVYSGCGVAILLAISLSSIGVLL